MHFIMGKISNVTNSTDPQLINSRTFVGNLNTFVLTKDDIESIFQRYGRIIGISMHKGYAFVQYKTEQEARNAVAGEDQRIYANQPIDVNLAAEPKPNRPSRKRPHGAGSEWDYYYNTPVRPLPPPPPLKRPRADLGALMAMSHLKPTLLPLRPGVGPPTIALDLNSKTHLKRLTRNHNSAGKSPNETPDILICGNCKQVFPDIEKLTSHKQIRCKLRFICKCDENSLNGKDGGAYVCATCQGEYTSAWELCQHVQNDHGVAIYQTKVDNSLFFNNDDAKSSSSTQEEEIEEKSDEGKTQEEEETTVNILHDDEEVPQGNGTFSTDEELEPAGDSGKADDVTVNSNDVIDISDL